MLLQLRNSCLSKKCGLYNNTAPYFQSRFSGSVTSTIVYRPIPLLNASRKNRLYPAGFKFIDCIQSRFFVTDSTSSKQPIERGESSTLRWVLPVEFQSKLAMADGLNPEEWKLIYTNQHAEAKWWNTLTWVTVSSIGIGFCVILLAMVLSATAYMNQLTNEDLIVSSVTILAVAAIGFLNRCRRLLVFRIYQRMNISKKHAAETNQKREYCIIWFNFWRKRQRFFYDHTQTSGAKETKKTLPSPTFYARKRPWYVMANWFADPDDYFYTRMPIDKNDKKST